MLNLVFNWKGWFLAGALGPLVLLSFVLFEYFKTEREKYKNDPENYELNVSLKINFYKSQVLWLLFVLTFLVVSGPIGFWIVLGIIGALFFDHKFVDERTSVSRLDGAEVLSFALSGPAGLLVGSITKLFDRLGFVYKLRKWGESLGLRK